MRSIKPGRGPSMMGGVMSIFMACFGVLWMIFVSAMGGDFFALFGLFFVAIAIVQAVYHFKNATSKNRYSAFDITDANEEPDPLNEHFSGQSAKNNTNSSDSIFCPYCGKKADDGFVYCNRCGKKLP